MSITAYDIYLQKLGDTGSEFIAQDSSGLSESDITKKLSEDSNFANKITTAKSRSLDKLLQEARRRAIGYEENVYVNGEFIGTKTVSSDALMIFLLKNLHPSFTSENGDDNMITVNINNPY